MSQTTISSSTVPVLYYGIVVPIPSYAEYIAIDKQGFIKAYEEEPKSEKDIESKGGALPFYRSQPRKECLSTVTKVQDCSWMTDVLFMLNNGVEWDAIEARIPNSAYLTDADYIIKHQPSPKMDSKLEQLLRTLLTSYKPHQIMMMIPDWATYIAIDESGEMYAHSQEPLRDMQEQCWSSPKSELIGSIIGYRVNSNMFDWTKSKQKLRKTK